MDTIEVRLAKPSDWEWVYYKSKGMPRTFDLSYEEFQQSFEVLLAAQDDQQFILLTAQWHGVTAGYIAGHINYSFNANSKVAWVEECFVKESLRNIGIGQALMSAFEEQSRSFDAVMVCVNSKVARKFWLSLEYSDSEAGDHLHKLIKYPYNS